MRIPAVERRRMLLTVTVAALSALATEHFLKPSLKRRLKV